MIMQHPKVSCVDQAYALKAFGAAIGIDSDMYYTAPFGYINTINLINVGNCNNPFYTNPNNPPNKICGSDDATRSKFFCHVYVVYEGNVFDACIGPSLGTMSRQDYYNSVVDISTTNEYNASMYSPIIPFGDKIDGKIHWYCPFR